MSPTTERVRRLFDDMRWADEAMMGAARTVPDPEYHRHRGFSHGSIHGLLVHPMAAQAVWPRRREGDGDAAIGVPTLVPTRDDLRRRRAEVHSAPFASLDRPTEESLRASVVARNTDGERFSLPPGETMIPVVDHDTDHRGQINSMIALGGGTPAAAYYQHYLALAKL